MLVSCSVGAGNQILGLLQGQQVLLTDEASLQLEVKYVVILRIK